MLDEWKILQNINNSIPNPNYKGIGNFTKEQNGYKEPFSNIENDAKPINRNITIEEAINNDFLSSHKNSAALKESANTNTENSEDLNNTSINELNVHYDSTTTNNDFINTISNNNETIAENEFELDNENNEFDDQEENESNEVNYNETTKFNDEKETNELFNNESTELDYDNKTSKLDNDENTEYNSDVSSNIDCSINLNIENFNNEELDNLIKELTAKKIENEKQIERLKKIKIAKELLAVTDLQSKEISDLENAINS